jgi:hypothetical protein
VAIIKLNGNTYFIDADTVEIKPVSNGRWHVQMNDLDQFIVVGGRKSGGARNEWFCHEPRLYGDTWLPCKSMIAAIKLGCSY